MIILLQSNQLGQNIQLTTYKPHLLLINKHMIKALVSDFSRVILSPADENYVGGLNALHRNLSGLGDYNFWEYFRLNEDLLAFYQTIREQIPVYVFTSEYIQEHPALQPKMQGIFKYIFSAARLGLKKNDTETYKIIAEKINLKPEEILYIDDNKKNLDASNEAGMTVIHYESNDQEKKDVINILKKLFQN